jgi:DNA-binding beta-propeller fold protein YncE
MGRKINQALIALCCLLASCIQDKPPAIVNTAVPGGTGNVYIICQGALGNGNASLYAYDPANDSIYGDIYKQANNQPLGDVFQSMIRIGSDFFLCVDNSNEIMIINAATKKNVASIPVPQPRYILPVSASKAYVSSLFHNKVYIINTQNYTLTDSITLPNQNTEGMCLYNNNAVICTWDSLGNHIYMIDYTTDKLVQTIQVAGYTPQSVVVDKQQMLWVLGTGSFSGLPATWTRLDPSTGDILASYTFPASAVPLGPVFNSTLDTIYYIEANYSGGAANNGVYRMSIYDAGLPSQPLIPALPLQYFYALGVSPVTGYLFVGDPLGFNQNGSLYIYKPDGTLVQSFIGKLGLGPGGFYFDE